MSGAGSRVGPRPRDVGGAAYTERMPHDLTPRDQLRLRMRAQGLALHGQGSTAAVHSLAPGTTAAARAGTARTGAKRIADVARGMLAVQGQDWRSARWALGVRAPETTVADVEAAFAEHRIVRSWPMRGTVHLVAAEDIGWMQRATNHRVLAGAPKRREMLGMSDAVLEHLVETSLAAIDNARHDTASPGLDREALAEAWTAAGIDWQSSWRYHLIWWICQNGWATFGPVGATGEPLLVRSSDWITTPRELAGDEALAELATRYAAARGPVRDKDFAWWTGLTVTEARTGIAAAAESGALVEARALDNAGDPVRGVAGKLWVDPALLDSMSASDADANVNTDADLAEWQLLAAFDEHLLGYQNRDAQLDPEHFERIVPGRNGMFLATVVNRGRVVGTWKRGRTKAGGIEVTPFPGARIDTAALEVANQSWSEFHGVSAGGVIVR